MYVSSKNLTSINWLGSFFLIHGYLGYSLELFYFNPSNGSLIQPFRELNFFLTLDDLLILTGLVVFYLVGPILILTGLALLCPAGYLWYSSSDDDDDDDDNRLKKKWKKKLTNWLLIIGLTCLGLGSFIYLLNNHSFLPRSSAVVVELTQNLTQIKTQPVSVQVSLLAQKLSQINLSQINDLTSSQLQSLKDLTYYTINQLQKGLSNGYGPQERLSLSQWLQTHKFERESLVNLGNFLLENSYGQPQNVLKSTDVDAQNAYQCLNKLAGLKRHLFFKGFKDY